MVTITDYGSILKACRERSGMSQEDMAFELHRDQACISRFEQGKKSIELSEAIKWLQITQASEVAVAFFLGVDGLAVMQQVMEVVTSISTIINLGVV